MTKVQCEAIIKAIQETANLIMTNGVTIRNQIPDKTSDDAYVQGLLTAYGTAIDAILANVPDDE